MGRGKVVMKRIENKVNREVTFSKRRHGLLKKAHELAVLCDAHLGVVIISTRGKLFEYCSPHTSWSELIQRYDSNNAQLQGTDHDDDQQMLAKIGRLTRERDQLKASIRTWQTGEDLSPLSAKDLDNLQKQLESALGKIRARKDELLNQQVDRLHQKVQNLEDQNSTLRHVMNEDVQHRAAAEARVVAEVTAPATLTGGFLPEVEELSTSLQLWPQQLPALQGFGLQGHSMPQW